MSSAQVSRCIHYLTMKEKKTHERSNTTSMLELTTNEEHEIAEIPKRLDKRASRMVAEYDELLNDLQTAFQDIERLQEELRLKDKENLDLNAENERLESQLVEMEVALDQTNAKLDRIMDHSRVKREHRGMEEQDSGTGYFSNGKEQQKQYHSNSPSANFNYTPHDKSARQQRIGMTGSGKDEGEKVNSGRHIGSALMSKVAMGVSCYLGGNENKSVPPSLPLRRLPKRSSCVEIPCQKEWANDLSLERPAYGRSRSLELKTNELLVDFVHQDDDVDKAHVSSHL